SGAPHGAVPVSWGCLDIVRVEGALLFFPFDMPHQDTTPWETRQDWAVDLGKPDFRGKKALAEKRGKERTLNVGLEVRHDAAVAPGAKIVKDGAEIGTVNSTTWSRYLMKSLALGAVKPEFSAPGTEVEVRDGDKTLKANVVRTPFYDPLRLRTHPRD
ncbi:MAG: aminomethyltransferase family protein, partial [Acetobacteraceae bacterium]|nr:aminomethyltransferase family protein [Acetobacteraceae bacterium]